MDAPTDPRPPITADPAPPAPLPPPTAPPTSPPAAPPSGRPRRVPGWSGAVWLAGTGVTMLLAASVILVASRWESIDPSVRFAGLVASLIAVYFTAESLRSRVPQTAASLAVLAATLTAPVGIAAMATIGRTWPVAIVVGGTAALVATELQARRWRVSALHAATVVAYGVAATGVAALTEVPVALLGAAGALAASLLGATRRSVALACATAATPWLVLLDAWGVGPGTLARLGASGPVLDWTVPVTSTAASVVVAIASVRRSSRVLVITAAALATHGALVSLALNEAHEAFFWSLPAVALLLVEAVAVFGRDSVLARSADRVRSMLAVGVAALAAVLATTSMFSSDSNATPSDVWVVALAASAIAVTISARRRSVVTRVADLLPVASAGCATAAVFLVWGAVPAASTALVTWIATSATTAWRNWVLITAAHVYWVGLLLDGMPERPLQAAFAGAAGVTMMIACACDGRVGVRLAGTPVALAATVATVGIFLPGQLAWLAVGLLIGAVATTGVAMLSDRFDVVDTLGLTAGVLAVAFAPAVSALTVSLSFVVVTTQATLYGAAFHKRWVAIVGGIGALGSLTSIWWTSGANAATLRWLEPTGIRGDDLTIAACVALLLLAGAALRRMTSTTTWLAYGPGLGLCVTWLLTAQGEPAGDWATFAALVVGVVATGVGGVRLLAAPLVAGLVALAGTAVISAGPQLAEAPTWAWIAIGGVTLIILAALVERSERPVLPTRTGDPSLLGDVCSHFD